MRWFGGCAPVLPATALVAARALTPTIDHPTSKEERGMGPGVLKRDGAAVVTGGAAGPPNGNGGLRGAEE